MNVRLHAVFVSKFANLMYIFFAASRLQDVLSQSRARLSRSQLVRMFSSQTQFASQAHPSRDWQLGYSCNTQHVKATVVQDPRKSSVSSDKCTSPSTTEAHLLIASRNTNTKSCKSLISRPEPSPASVLDSPSNRATRNLACQTSKSEGTVLIMSYGAYSSRFWDGVAHLVDKTITMWFKHCLTPYHLYDLALHIFFSSPRCNCSHCKLHRLKEGMLGLGSRVAIFMVALLTAPHCFPQYAWHYLFPPPCTHRRCLLRRYVSPPPPPRPFYQYVVPEQLYQPIQAHFRGVQAGRLRGYDPDAFPFFRLPVEIRNLIYLHASGSRKYDVRYRDPWRFKPQRFHPIYEGLDKNTATFIEEYDPSRDLVCFHRGPDKSDGISYQLQDNGIIAYHGSRPLMDLLLACRQMHDEAKDQFLSTTAFEVQPLTPNDASWRLDYSLQPTYDALAKSVYASMARKVLVRIDISRFIMGRQTKRFVNTNSQICTFDDVNLGVCTEIVTSLADKLCDALRKRVPKLKVVVIHWVDEFPEAIEETDLQMRANVLIPFTELAGVRIRVGKMIVAERARAAVMGMMNQALGN